MLESLRSPAELRDLAAAEVGSEAAVDPDAEREVPVLLTVDDDLV